MQQVPLIIARVPLPRPELDVVVTLAEAAQSTLRFIGFRCPLWQVQPLQRRGITAAWALHHNTALHRVVYSKAVPARKSSWMREMGAACRITVTPYETVAPARDREVNVFTEVA